MTSRRTAVLLSATTVLLMLLNMGCKAQAATRHAFVLMHGLYQTPESVEKMTHFGDLAIRHGVKVVRPNGGGSWNAGGCCGRAVEEKRDHISLLVGVIRALREQGYGQVHLVGFSNGGMMAYRYACERGGVDSVMVVAGALTTSTCSKQFRVLHVHGTADKTVPYNGGYSQFTGYTFKSVPSEVHRAPNALVYIRKHSGAHVWPSTATNAAYNWAVHRQIP